jgi:predicted metal-dependent peptidase
LGEDAAATLGPADLARIRADVLNRLQRSGAASHGLRTALMGNTPKAPWQALLRRLLRPKLSNSVSKQHTWNRANRRNEKTFVLPGINRRGAHVGIVFDTSASMDQDLLNRAAAELSGILRAARIRTVTLVSCDDEATVPLALAPTSTISLLGGGATDLTVGIDALMALSSPPPVIVVLTDGFTPWPEAAPTGTQLICGVFDRQAPLPSGHGIEALYIP